jgi:hypothetical protein
MLNYAFKKLKAAGKRRTAMLVYAVGKGALQCWFMLLKMLEKAHCNADLCCWKRRTAMLVYAFKNVGKRRTAMLIYAFKNAVGKRRTAMLKSV